jgi:hypothetical protein
MQVFSELLKYGVIQIITPSILAIILVFITKNQEKKYNQDNYIFEKKREAFTNTLSLITKLITSIQANYSWEENKYRWIDEKDCDNFQMMVQNEMLYLNDDDISTIQFIVKIIRQNSSWQSNIISWDESSGFLRKDIVLIEHLYKILTVSFRKQLFYKYKQKFEKNYTIPYLKMSYLINNNIIQENKIDKVKFSKFNYTENTILETINNFHNNIHELHCLLEEIIKQYKERTNNTDYDKQKIDELSDLLQRIK